MAKRPADMEGLVKSEWRGMAGLRFLATVGHSDMCAGQGVIDFTFTLTAAAKARRRDAAFGPASCSSGNKVVGENI